MEPIETERLLLRPFVTDDLNDLYNLIYSDPEVCRPFCGKTKTREEARKVLNHKIHEAEHYEGFGSYAIVLKAQGSFLGYMLLGPPEVAHYLRFEETDHRVNSIEVELGYVLARRYWGKGYVTEAGKALVEFAFKKLRLKRLITGADKEKNPRSYEVGRRRGAKYVRNIHPKWPGLIGIIENNSI